ncbi:hypothetical protein [Dryocola sp. BD626]|uniref:hypothetical protein n=1 Tax=Dryocola sp. BD626 TaxID=3133273 RepID=UPI003F50AF41
MDKGIEELLENAKQSAAIMQCIASFEPQDIDGDDVELRFEIDDVETGADISVVEQCGKASAFLTALIAALEQAQQKNSIPDGWVLVPKEPTEEMITAAYKHEVALFGVGHADLGIYAAMLSAAPKSELEARPLCVKLPGLASIHCNWSADYMLKSDVIDAIRAAGGTVEGSEWQWEK